MLAGGERPKLGVDMWQLIGEVRCPILSVRGTRSDMYAPETVAKMKAANPRLEVVEVDAGHDIAGENEAALVGGHSEEMDTRGIDHLALVCDDMPAAMDFYTRVMGFRLVHVRRVPYEQDRWQPPYDNLRHYFFDMGNDSLFAIFEYPKGLPRQNRDHVGGMQHVAFHVAPERFDRLVEHVRAAASRCAGRCRSAGASGRRTSSTPSAHAWSSPPTGAA